MHDYVVFNLDNDEAYVVKGKTRARVERRLGAQTTDRCVVHVASARDIELVKAGMYFPPGMRRSPEETMKRMKSKGQII